MKPGIPIHSKTKHLSPESLTHKQIVIEPTCVHANSSIIDHIATTLPKNKAKSGVLPNSMSDNFIVFCVHKFEDGLLKDHKTIKAKNEKLE